MLERINSEAAVPAPSSRRHVLRRDYETRSQLDLRKVGAHKYAAHPGTDVLCCAYDVDNGPVKLWWPNDPVPAEFIAASSNANWIVAAFNDAFEAAIETHIMHPRHGWPLIPAERHCCSMGAVLAQALPSKLESVAKALELLNQKDAAGHRLIADVQATEAEEG
jgi:DNA polymerase bacteriophage-type